MSNKIKYSIIAFLLFSFALCVIFIPYFKSADVVAVYTRNNLSWKSAELLEDGSIKLDLSKGKTTVQLRNNVAGTIGYNLYLYTEKETASEATVSAKDMTEINEKEYPGSLKECYIKGAYRGYLAGGGEKNFKIKADSDADLRLLMIMEDNNSYPKEEKNIPTIANVKFSAEVLLDGQYARGKKYSFSLKDAQGTVIETVQNDDGYISFSNIALKEKGTYIYYLSQNEGKDKETDYDKSIYKIKVVAEGKNAVKVSYEKDGTRVETLPRFSNYKERTELVRTENAVEYPTNEKKDDAPTNFLLIIAAGVALLIIIFYIVSGRKKG